LDLSTVRLSFQLVNQSGIRTLNLTGHPGMCIFERARLLVGGTLVEDVLLNNRTSSMVNRLKPPQRLWTESLEMLGAANGGLDVPDADDTTYAGGPKPSTIPPASARTVITPLSFGLFQTHYLFPLRWPIVIELYLVSDAAMCCSRGIPGVDVGQLASQDFRIQNCRLLGDVVMCDNAIMEELACVVREGGALPLQFNSYSTTQHSLALNIPANGTTYSESRQSWSIVLSRAFTRVKSIFVTFDNPASYGPMRTQSSNFLAWTAPSDRTKDGLGGDGYPAANAEGFRFQVQLGSSLWPDQPLTSFNEAAYQLFKGLGLTASNDGHSIAPGQYLNHDFIILVDFERASAGPGSGLAAYTGISTRTPGDSIRLAWENVLPRTGTIDNAGVKRVSDTGSWPTTCYITLHYDCQLELRAEGVLLLD
jgi:hypothetical protein